MRRTAQPKKTGRMPKRSPAGRSSARFPSPLKSRSGGSSQSKLPSSMRSRSGTGSPSRRPSSSRGRSQPRFTPPGRKRQSQSSGLGGLLKSVTSGASKGKRRGSSSGGGPGRKPLFALLAGAGAAVFASRDKLRGAVERRRGGSDETGTAGEQSVNSSGAPQPAHDIPGTSPITGEGATESPLAGARGDDTSSAGAAEPITPPPADRKDR